MFGQQRYTRLRTVAGVATRRTTAEWDPRVDDVWDRGFTKRVTEIQFTCRVVKTRAFDVNDQSVFEQKGRASNVASRGRRPCENKIGRGHRGGVSAGRRHVRNWHGGWGRSCVLVDVVYPRQIGKVA